EPLLFCPTEKARARLDENERERVRGGRGRELLCFNLSHSVGKRRRAVKVEWFVQCSSKVSSAAVLGSVVEKKSCNLVLFSRAENEADLSSGFPPFPSLFKPSSCAVFEIFLKVLEKAVEDVRLFGVRL